MQVHRLHALGDGPAAIVVRRVVQGSTTAAAIGAVIPTVELVPGAVVPVGTCACMLGRRDTAGGGTVEKRG